MNLNNVFHLMSSRVAGEQHHDWKDNLVHLHATKNLLMRLEAEPTNPHDDKAIKVVTEGDGNWLLGHLPRNQQAQLLAFRLLAGGYKLFAELNPNSIPANVIIDIYMERAQ